ncbi:hypothetical protein RZS08_07430, partial [Arthrospira platensis SPKY1]|nr:hypothetical protein [Arthrospira platensis SPKY1]
SASAPANQVINWTYGPGKYLVVGTPANPDLYCTDRYQIVVDVKPLPPPPAIDGPALICPGTPYAYAISSGQPNGIFNWTITDGGAVYTEEGPSVVVTWGPTPPYELEVTQTGTSGPNCPSASVGLAAQALTGLTLSGPSESCVETTTVFATDDVGAGNYEWAILPPGVGTIISGDGTATVEVLWHTAGAATVEVSLCGHSASAGMTIHPGLEPDPLFPVGVCAGSTVQVSTQTAFATYQWLDENGVLVSTDPDPQLAPGTYEVVAINALGCEGNSGFVIEEFPIPEIFISTPDPTGYCAGHPPATL